MLEPEPTVDTRLESLVLNDGKNTYQLEPDADNNLILQNAPHTLDLATTTLTAVAILKNTNATISPDPTTARSYENPVVFTVTAEDGTTTKTYTAKIADYNASTNPYGIYNASDLNDVRNGLGKSYKLMNDIALPNTNSPDAVSITGISDYAAKGWKPIGNSSDKYAGTFDGNGYIITNLTITRDEEVVGLFGSIATAGIIKNLGIETSIAGILQNLSFSKIAVLSAENGGKINNCCVIGGLVKQSSSYSTGGGLVGNNLEGGVIDNCYSKCAVTSEADNTQTAGLVGSNEGTIMNSWTSGKVTTLSTVYSSGLIGQSTSSSTATNSYWDKETTGWDIGIGNSGGGSSAGITGKTTADMKTQATVNALNGSQNPNPWKYVAGQYPKLAWEK